MYNKFEKSSTYSQLFKGDMAIPFENVLKVDMAPAVVTRLFTNPLEILPATPGYFNLPSLLLISKPAGGAYGVAGALGIGVYWKTGGIGTPAITMGAVVFTEVFSANAAGLGVTPNANGVNGTANYLYLGNTNAPGVFLDNMAFEVRVTGANLSATASTPNLRLLLVYRSLPLTIAPN